MGTYSDKVDYTFQYKISDNGAPFSVNLNDETNSNVTITEGQPYDIRISGELVK